MPERRSDSESTDPTTERDRIPTEGEYPPVDSKQDFVRRYKAGEFGNAAPTWDDIKSFLESGWDEGPVHIRNRIAGGPTWYDVLPRNVPGVWERACRFHGCDPSSLYISAMAPTQRTMIQGELMQTPKGLEFFYSPLALPMREALNKSFFRTFGVGAIVLCKFYMNPVSFDWLHILLERYPGHVIEFSVYSVEWGTLPGYNTVFWEVRNY